MRHKIHKWTVLHKAKDFVASPFDGWISKIRLNIQLNVMNKTFFYLRFLPHYQKLERSRRSWKIIIVHHYYVFACSTIYNYIFCMNSSLLFYLTLTYPMYPWHFCLLLIYSIMKNIHQLVYQTDDKILISRRCFCIWTCVICWQ
jgi:hypothetical protein